MRILSFILRLSLSIAFVSACLISRASGYIPQNAMSMDNMRLIAPVFFEGLGYSTHLHLVNSSEVKCGATLIIRDRNGAVLNRTHITLGPESQTERDVADFLPSKSSFVVGSLILVQDPGVAGAVINGAISLLRSSGRFVASLDEELIMPMEADAHTLRGIFSAANFDPIIAITSLSNLPQTMSLTCLWDNGNIENVSFELAPRHTTLTSSCAIPQTNLKHIDDMLVHGNGRTVGITLESNRTTSDFSAFGIRSIAGSASIRGINFDDSLGASPRTWAYVGVPMGKDVKANTDHLVRLSFANFSDQEKVINVKMYTSSSDRIQQTREMNYRIAPRSVRDELIKNSKNNGLLNTVVVSIPDGVANVAFALTSIENVSHTEVTMVAKDLGSQENAGTHPWSTAGNAKSQLLLWNPQSSDGKIWINLSTASQKWMKTISIRSHQTIALDIKNLLEHKEKDDEGRILPSSLEKGQISWVGFGYAKGRLMQVGMEISRNHSFSCGTAVEPCGQGPLSPASPNVDMRKSVSVGALVNYCLVQLSCQGSQFGTNSSLGQDNWTSSNSSIAGVTPVSNFSATVQGNSAGSSVIVDTVTTLPSDPLYYMHCSGSASGTVTVNAAIPVNFRQTIGRDDGGGVIAFQYNWDSSSGNLSDLNQCTLREYLVYPGSGPSFTFPNPPYASYSDTNPGILGGIAATLGVASDHHYPGNGFVTPYVATDFSINQKYQFSCSNYNGGAWTDLLTNQIIERKTEQNPNSSWKYTIAKAGVSASIDPLP